MIIKNKNDGTKIHYSIDGNKLSLNDELIFNLEHYERDEANHIDICRDKYGNLVSGVIPGLAESYVAQIDIPKREYKTVETEAPAEQGEGQTHSVTYEAVPFDINKVTLTLWAI